MILVLLAAGLVMSTALGIRQTFGLFLGPLGAAQIAPMSQLALALALQNLVWGVAQPIAGGFADRFGPGAVVAAGGALTALGLAAVALHPDLPTVVVGFGVLLGLGQSCMTFAVVISAVSRRASEAQRATAVGIAAAGGSLGQVALVPFAQLALGFGYRHALVALAAIALLAAPFGFVLGGRGMPDAASKRETKPASLRAIRTALADSNYLFVTAGFFACGFQLAFITAHLPTYLRLCGLGPSLGAASLALIGLFNIFGSYGCGRLMERYPPQLLLAALYTIRATAALAFVAIPVSASTSLVFAVVMGVTWLGTVPLTNGVVTRLFGLPNLGALFGVCFLSHQIGSFLGVAVGGYAVERTGSYALVWAATVVIGYLAAVVNLPIRFRQPSLHTT
jgi:predicted MFS family arabinose efflux permease